MFFRWKCKDRRFYIHEIGSADDPAETIDAVCQWNKTYTLDPDKLECVPTFCDNATETPSSDGSNYNFVWDEELVPVNTFIKYQCQDDMRIENNTEDKESASKYSQVFCGPDAEFVYPDPWPQCSNTINCTDPGMTSEVNRTYISGDNLEYESILEYWCSDIRMKIRWGDIETSLFKNTKRTRCQWNKNFDRDGTAAVCEIHNCAHPHNDPGSHPPPPPENNITLVNRNWVVAFGDVIMYLCDEGTFIENKETDPTQTNITVKCIPDKGEYDIPASWPNCTDTVICGQPPAIPVNGSIEWLNRQEYDDTYNSYVEYGCVNGSQFDTDSDGLGDEVTVTIRCQWSQVWAPYPQLPECKITHCVDPFPIPEDTFLEELTSNWTRINEHKEYQCQGKMDGIHTRFWESDRSLSTFSMLCKEDGTFDFVNIRDNWPTCLEGMNQYVLTKSTIFC